MGFGELIFLFVLAGWFYLAVAISGWMTEKINSEVKRRWVRAGAFLLLLALPVADELIGQVQFQILCEKNASEFRVGVADPQGRKTRWVGDPMRKRVSGSILPIFHTRSRFIDIYSGEVVVEFDDYLAEGGFFIDTFRPWEGRSPLTFNFSTCSPEKAKGESVTRTLKFEAVN